MGRLNKIVLLLMVVTSLGCLTPKPSPPIVHIPPVDPIPKNNKNSLEQASKALSEIRKTVVNHAIKSIGTPYAWGGSSPSTGFDCSGLVAYTHSRVSIATPRTAKELFKKGRPISLPDLTPGDLIFFNSPDKKDNFHVGIYIGKDIFIHAPGQGRPVKWTRLENPYFSRNFIGARSFIQP